MTLILYSFWHPSICEANVTIQKKLPDSEKAARQCI